jgi:hypothetical protein
MAFSPLVVSASLIAEQTKIRKSYAEFIDWGLQDDLADPLHGSVALAHHELRVEPEHAVPRAYERPLAACVGFASLRMARAVDLDDEPNRGRQEVDDVPSQQGHLPLESHAEPLAAKCLEEPRLGESRRVAHPVGVRFECAGS